MGAKSTRLTGAEHVLLGDYRLDLDSDDPVLTKTTAWTVAMAWRVGVDIERPWRAPLRLETEHDNISIAESYEWVKFQWTDCGRFATVAWFWLSCCAGYSGRENPRFWKRVFSELTREPERYPRIADLATESVLRVTDSIRFFDSPEREFPRVSFGSYDSSSAEVLCGVSSWLKDPAEDAKLKTIFEKLRPFLIRERLERAVQVRVSEQQYDVIGSATTTYRLPYDKDIRACWPRFEAVTKRANAVRVPMVEAASQSERTQVGVLMGIQESPSQHTHYSEIHMTRDLLGERVLESVCSALPQATKATKVSVTVPPRRVVGHGFVGPRYESMSFPPYSVADWSWLGFELFHPSARSSS